MQRFYKGAYASDLNCIGPLIATRLGASKGLEAYCTVLYCTVLHCTVLYCTVLYCTVLYCTVLYCTVLSGPQKLAIVWSHILKA